MRHPRNLVDEVWLLLQAAFWSAHADGCFGIAKAAAYSALVSFFPLLTTIAALLVQANAPGRLASTRRTSSSTPCHRVQRTLCCMFLRRGALARVGYLWLATAASIWGASGFMLSLMEGFQAAYRSKNQRSFWRQRGDRRLRLVFIAALPACWRLGVAAVRRTGGAERWASR